MKKLVMSAMIVASSFSVVAADDFATLDVDNSGTITKEEAMQNVSLVHQFKELDKNSDGELSKEEFANFKAS
ncbi:EF-hand domain-containing protein [Pseudoalteromonas piratica]|uniref:Calmodulin n=1 Tax=Pseudoalteromonas piratica TaxID=1348114 RepID=A0A0A7ELB8_9GAMM|nr:EF-hand domain-containing protein [Pseudoalteromonas piratica]AIY66866.1 calmodulin [Pseudoalteromonas piratica]